MCTKVTLFASLKKKETEEAVTEVRKLEKERGVQLSFLGSSQALDSYMNLPAILTDEGDRAYGVAGIKTFVDGQLARSDC